MFLITAAKVVVMVGLVGRLISLQINQATKYKSLSDKNRFREWKLAPERGAIKDFFDTKIASTEPLYQLHLVPENVKDIDNLFVRLKAILNISDRKVSYLKRVIKKQKPWEPVIVSENLDWSEFSRINLFLHELEGVEPIVSVARNETTLDWKERKRFTNKKISSRISCTGHGNWKDWFGKKIR